MSGGRAFKSNAYWSAPMRTTPPQHGEVAPSAELILIIAISNDRHGRGVRNQGCGTGQCQSARAVSDLDITGVPPAGSNMPSIEYQQLPFVTAQNLVGSKLAKRRAQGTASDQPSEQVARLEYGDHSVARLRRSSGGSITPIREGKRLDSDLTRQSPEHRHAKSGRLLPRSKIG